MKNLGSEALTGGMPNQWYGSQAKYWNLSQWFQPWSGLFGRCPSIFKTWKLQNFILLVFKVLIIFLWEISPKFVYYLLKWSVNFWTNKRS